MQCLKPYTLTPKVFYTVARPNARPAQNVRTGGAAAEHGAARVQRGPHARDRRAQRAGVARRHVADRVVQPRAGQARQVLHIGAGARDQRRAARTGACAAPALTLPSPGSGSKMYTHS